MNIVNKIRKLVVLKQPEDENCVLSTDYEKMAVKQYVLYDLVTTDTECIYAPFAVADEENMQKYLSGEPYKAFQLKLPIRYFER